jgi:hypothetical protein
MVQPHEASIDDVIKFYNDPNTQSDAVHYISYLKMFENTEDDQYLEKAFEIAISIVDRCPYDEVTLDDEVTDSPSEIMMVTCLYLAEAGMIHL